MPRRNRGSHLAEVVDSSNAMSATEVRLCALYGPVVPLREVCKRYLGLSYKEACRRAAVCQLRVPTFKLRDSERAPYLIHAKDLAAWIDSQAGAARAIWEHCQAEPPSWLHQLSWQRQHSGGLWQQSAPALMLVEAEELEVAIAGRTATDEVR